ncbi:hypothetical protein FHL15_007621 [Xylaria flabelliformis]|uniref:Uncharacterized protein n=1 Tax=Xylaria flabelliformis TaxID=2512241 RepID=A0A553HU00_9PEZI|nr:hypothetical protein FHL15_007621 [Xylaria flabelliformis]
MASAVPGIADDWEYINDDTFSIHSLASEGDAPEPSRASEAVCAVDSPGSLTDDPGHRPRSESPTPNDSSPSDTKTHPNSAQGVGKCYTNQTIVIRPVTLRKQPEAEVLKASSEDALCKRIKGLTSQLSGLLSNPGLCGSTHSHLRITCEALRSQLDWTLNTSCFSALPEMLTTLSELVRSLEHELLQIQKRLEMLYLDQANEWPKNIDQLRVQLEAIITGIQSDFPVQSPLMLGPRRISLTTDYKANERPPTCITSGSGKNSWAHLRQELCALRDQIVACLGEIHSYEHHGIYDLCQRMKIIAFDRSFKNTKELLERRLASTLRGPTDHGVRQLNPDTISSLVLQLKEVTDVLFNERCKVQARRRRDGRYEYEKLFISAPNMDTLTVVDETLVSIFQSLSRKQARSVDEQLGP